MAYAPRLGHRESPHGKGPPPSAPGDEAARIAAAFTELAASPELNLLHRYETRLHHIYQRALFNLALLGECESPKEPSPISEHPVLQLPSGVDDARVTL